VPLIENERLIKAVNSLVQVDCRGVELSCSIDSSLKRSCR
jgi:hypothetical protein